MRSAHRLVAENQQSYAQVHDKIHHPARITSLSTPHEPCLLWSVSAAVPVNLPVNSPAAYAALYTSVWLPLHVSPGASL
jgi:hypothetical protein